MKTRFLLLVLLGGLFPSALNASIIEDIHFSHIGLEEGLSHSTIFAINQDKDKLPIKINIQIRNIINPIPEGGIYSMPASK
ncbi:MAG TPA: hypothetical protein K8W04_10000 [Bacteroides reticulotermitis]|nr:hypothetical protein [Bacteroides reticulotermitis]